MSGGAIKAFGGMVWLPPSNEAYFPQRGVWVSPAEIRRVYGETSATVVLGEHDYVRYPFSVSVVLEVMQDAWRQRNGGR